MREVSARVMRGPGGYSALERMPAILGHQRALRYGVEPSTFPAYASTYSGPSASGSAARAPRPEIPSFA